jgi:DNA modification methylase
MTFRTETLADGIVCILGDCLEVLPTLGRFDAVVTDPPYGIGYAAQPIVGKGKSKSNHEKKAWDDAPIILEPALNAAKTHIIWGGNYYDLPPKIAAKKAGLRLARSHNWGGK